MPCLTSFTIDNVVIFQSPISAPTESFSFHNSPADNFTYSIDLPSFFDMTSPLGILWHPIEKKGQDFAFSVKYVSFLWEISSHQVSLTDKKCAKLLGKLDAFLLLPHLMVSHQECTSLHSSLQHITFVYRDGCSVLPPLSTFISKFRNDHSHLHIPGLVLNCT